MFDAFIQHLGKRLQEPLPGEEAQFRMAVIHRRTTMSPPEDVRIASVLALFYPKDEETHLVLIERPAVNANDPHSGQLSFPGGKFELEDPDYRYTALRETQEEIGVDPEAIQVLGRLSELYIPVSNFLVHPFVGYTPERPHFVPQESEVKSILEVPFSLIANQKTLLTTDLTIRNGMVLKEVPYFNVYGKILWGATAMMLSELIQVIEG